MTQAIGKRVLVTGATGLLGHHSLAPLAARGYEVHAVSSRPVDPPAANWHHVDLLDLDAVARLVETVRPSHLLHYAWTTEHGAYWTSAENLQWCQASLELVRRFQQYGGRRVVMAGTCAEYDWADGVCDEVDTPLRPSTLYGTTKHALRLMVESFAATTSLSASWGRVFWVYGPHERPERLVAAVCQALLRGEPARCSHGEQKRDILYGTDAGEAFAALLDSPVTGAVNIGSGTAVALKTVVTMIAALLQCPELLQLGVMAAPIGDPPLLVAETSRLNREVGWYPQTDLAQGLRETIDWWRATLAADTLMLPAVGGRQP